MERIKQATNECIEKYYLKRRTYPSESSDDQISGLTRGPGKCAVQTPQISRNVEIRAPKKKKLKNCGPNGGWSLDKADR